MGTLDPAASQDIVQTRFAGELVAQRSDHKLKLPWSARASQPAKPETVAWEAYNSIANDNAPIAVILGCLTFNDCSPPDRAIHSPLTACQDAMNHRAEIPRWRMRGEVTETAKPSPLMKLGN